LALECWWQRVHELGDDDVDDKMVAMEEEQVDAME
jgi:hypothetical protein